MHHERANLRCPRPTRVSLTLLVGIDRALEEGWMGPKGEAEQVQVGSWASASIRIPLWHEWQRAFLRWRPLVEALADSFIWALSLVVATWVRYELAGRATFTWHLSAMVGLAVVAQVSVGWATSLYRVRWRVGSFEQMVTLAGTTLLTATIVAGVSLAGSPHLLPASATIGAGALAIVFGGAVRLIWRLNRERKLRPADQAERAIVFGAGDGGVQLIGSLLTNPSSPYLPVGLLDDDPQRQNDRIRQLRVSGTRADLGALARRTRAETVIVAIPSAHSNLIRDLSVVAIAAGLSVKVLPPVSQLLDFKVAVDDVRPITEVDLLGRRVVDTEVESIAGYLRGRRVLVTGAGGSIGSELCRQIDRFGPARLVMLDRDESGLHQVQLSIEGRAMLDDRALVVCDIRDRAALTAAFTEHRPEVVFHAAALKHLPLLEMWPAEAIKTNVSGTRNVLEAASAVGVRRFVNISTDKAANPTSVLGFTKRLAERITAGFDQTSPGTYLSVRFGNVLGSRGSVLTAFRVQIDAGGPVTVTDREVTRYFMTVEEAVQLVIQAGAVGGRGQVLVLDMGEPVKIADVAKRLVLEAGRPIEIVYTGLRPAEKLHEELFGDGEAGVAEAHPLIFHVDVPALDSEAIDSWDLSRPLELLRAELLRRCTWNVTLPRGVSTPSHDRHPQRRRSVIDPADLPANKTALRAEEM